jgi:hypothetical protein
MAKITADKARILLFRQLAEGAGISEILQYAYEKIFRNPILLTNSAFRTVCTAGNDFEDEVWNQARHEGFFSEQVIDTFKSDSSSSRLFSMKEPFLYSSGLGESVPRILSAISFHDEIIGYTIIFQVEKKLTENDLLLTDALNEALRILMMPRGNESLSLNASEYMIKELLDGTEDPDQMDLAELKTQKYFRAVSASLPDDLKGKTYIKYLTEMMNQIDGSVVMVYGSNLFILLNYPAHHSSENDLSFIAGTLSRYSLSAGVSNQFEDIHEVREYYLQSCQAREIGKVLDPGRSLYRFRDYLSYAAFSEKSYAWMQAAVSDEYRAAEAYDSEHHTELIRTICVLYEHGMNVSEASEVLHLHRNTVNYRIGILQDKFRISLSDTKVLQAIYLSDELVRWMAHLR